MFLNIFDHANACASMCCWSKYTTRNNWNREFYSLANILTPAQMALYQPGCLLQKFLAVKAPGDLDTVVVCYIKVLLWSITIIIYGFILTPTLS